MASLAVSLLTAVVVLVLTGLWTYPAMGLANEYLNSPKPGAYPGYILAWTFVLLWAVLGFFLAAFAVGSFL